MSSSFVYQLMWPIVLVLIIISAVVYWRSRKIANLFFTLSIFTYFIGLVYVIDKFDFGKMGTLGALIVSAFLMMGIGAFFSKTSNAA